jgi:DNA-binding transcriptional ArsR family regulator
MEATLQALALPRRRAILELVRDVELPAGEIAARFEVTRPAISQHIAVLKEAGLLTERREGTRRLYRARPEGLRELQEYLDGFWHERLWRLKDAVESKRPRDAGAGEDAR